MCDGPEDDICGHLLVRLSALASIEMIARQEGDAAELLAQIRRVLETTRAADAYCAASLDPTGEE